MERPFPRKPRTGTKDSPYILLEVVAGNKPRRFIIATPSLDVHPPYRYRALFPRLGDKSTRNFRRAPRNYRQQQRSRVSAWGAACRVAPLGSLFSNGPLSLYSPGTLRAPRHPLCSALPATGERTDDGAANNSILSNPLTARRAPIGRFCRVHGATFGSHKLHDSGNSGLNRSRAKKVTGSDAGGLAV